MVVPCVNRQRDDWKSRWLTTRDADACHGRIVATSSAGLVVEDHVVFCGVPPQVPLGEVSLRTNDDRYHLPILSRLTEWVPHHTRSRTKVQPGVYLLGAKFFAGLTDAVRLPAGTYFIRVSINVQNGPSVDWEAATPEIVKDAGPIEDDISLTVLPSFASDVEWLNVEATASRRFESIENVRLRLTVNDKSHQINWSSDNGNMSGEPLQTLFPEAPLKAAIAIRATDATTHVLGCIVEPRRCYVTDVSFRVHKRPQLQLAVGEHKVLLSAFFGTKQIDWPLVVRVPPLGSGRLMMVRETESFPEPNAVQVIAQDRATTEPARPSVPDEKTIEVSLKNSDAGLEVMLRNHSPSKQTVSVRLNELLLWSVSHQIFAETTQFHTGGDGKFIPLNLGTVTDLLWDKAQKLPFISAQVGNEVGHLRGTAASVGREPNRRLQPGRYQATLRISIKDGVRWTVRVCFIFTKGKRIEPCDC